MGSSIRKQNQLSSKYFTKIEATETLSKSIHLTIKFTVVKYDPNQPREIRPIYTYSTGATYEG